MGAGVKIAVVANCQARPLALALPKLVDSVEVCGVVITHLAKDHEEADCDAFLSAADFIFAQSVVDAYPTAFVRTGALRRKYGAKVVSWPNLFFKGQTPDLCYVTTPPSRRVIGPLGDYQNRLVFDQWRAGRPASDAIRALEQGGDWLAALDAVPSLSLAELRGRPSDIGGAVIDYIESHWRDERLFFTFNHPTAKLLLMVATQLLRAIGLSPRDPNAVSEPERLDPIIPALLPVVAERLSIRLPASTRTKGRQIVIEGDSVRVGAAPPTFYELPAFVETSYRCLDAQIERDQEVRIT